MRFFIPLPPLLRGWLLSFLAFGLLAFLLVGNFAWTTTMPWTDALRMAARDWLPWAVMTPLIFRLVQRLPLERGRWKIGVPVYLLCGIATVALANWWAQSVMPPTYGRWRPGGDGRGPRSSQWRSQESRSRDARPPRPEEREPEADDAARGSTATTASATPSPRRRSGPGGPPGSRGGFSFFFMLGFRLPIYLAVVSIAHAVHFSRRARERERRALELTASLAQSRLEALKMQLQPHFLFNSLNAIAALVHKNPDAADEMLTRLSELLRLTLETSGAQELPLRRELELVEKYLAIEHVRFGDRLKYQVDVPPDTHAALVPTFLLQPLVENAVRHGLEPQSGAGLLTIRARREGGTLRLSVSDNGVGLKKDGARREGIGLSNTRARLRELYDGAASLELRNADGVSVEITMPFHTAA